MALLGYVISGILGLVMGSFAGATVWRLRARQVVSDEKIFKQLQAKNKLGELTASEKEDLEWLSSNKAARVADLARLKPLTKSTLTNDRSQCLHCHHELAWYDLLPLFSWISTNGKCRYCKKPIGRFEPIMELGTAGLFLLSFHYLLGNNLGFMALFWLVTMVMLVILFAYDFKWSILPDGVVFPLIVVALLYAGYTIAIASDPLQLLISTVVSVVILSGLYFVLWLVSGGRLVGFGDIKLGLALGLLLMNWKLAIMALFLANLVGTLIVLPGLLTHRISRKTQVPFGPMLIVGFFIALFWGQAILDGYNDFSNWLTTVLLML